MYCFILRKQIYFTLEISEEILLSDHSCSRMYEISSSKYKDSFRRNSKLKLRLRRQRVTYIFLGESTVDHNVYPLQNDHDTEM